MKISDLQFSAFGLAPSTYSLFPFPVPNAATTARPSNSPRMFHHSTYSVIPCSTFLTNGGLTAPSTSKPFLEWLPRTGHEPKFDETARKSVGEGCNGVHRHLWRLITTQSRTHQFVGSFSFYKMGPLICPTGIGSAIGTGLIVGSGRTLAMHVPLHCCRLLMC